jgi:predicted AAA+ superfamily ATPase
LSYNCKIVNVSFTFNREYKQPVPCRGGWPEAVLETNKEKSLNYVKNYIDILLSSDLINANKNQIKAKQVLRSYSRLISSSSPLLTIVKDLELKELISDIRTVDSYINAFKDLYLIEDVYNWSPKLRSKTTIRTSPTRQLIDPSIATATLDISPQDLLNDFNTFGLFFESLVICDLRIYMQNTRSSIYKYNDSSGLEIDAIIHQNNGKWSAIEIKLGSVEGIELAAKNLLKLKEKIDKIEGEPVFLMIITATGYAYRRNDNILVVPIDCLKP